MIIVADHPTRALPIHHQPKEGAVDSTFNEQSQMISPALLPVLAF